MGLINSPGGPLGKLWFGLRSAPQRPAGLGARPRRRASDASEASRSKASRRVAASRCIALRRRCVHRIVLFWFTPVAHPLSFSAWLSTSLPLSPPLSEMSCHVMSCHVMSCHVMSCHVMSCHVMSDIHTFKHVAWRFRCRKASACYA